MRVKILNKKKLLWGAYPQCAMAFFFNTETEIGNASGTDGSVQPHGKAILIKLKSKLYKLILGSLRVLSFTHMSKYVYLILKFDTN